MLIPSLFTCEACVTCYQYTVLEKTNFSGTPDYTGFISEYGVSHIWTMADTDPDKTGWVKFSLDAGFYNPFSGVYGQTGNGTEPTTEITPNTTVTIGPPVTTTLAPSTTIKPSGDDKAPEVKYYMNQTGTVCLMVNMAVKMSFTYNQSSDNATKFEVNFYSHIIRAVFVVSVSVLYMYISLRDKTAES